MSSIFIVKLLSTLNISIPTGNTIISFFFNVSHWNVVKAKEKVSIPKINGLNERYSEKQSLTNLVKTK